MKSAYLVLLAAFLSTSALADNSTIVVADDSSSGTYKKMLGEIIGACAGDINIVEAKGVTGGAPGNLDALVNNKVQAAFLHADVYAANVMADPSYKRYQTLVSLYPEPITIIALRESKSKKLGTMSWGNQSFNTLSDMAGYKVAASGGGCYTARWLQGQGQGGFEVSCYTTGKEAVSAVQSGDASAAVFVGAAPLPNIAELNKAEFRIIPIGESIGGKVTGLYRPVTINYPGLTNGPLKTMAPMATILTTKKNTPALIAAQRNFRSCFNAHLNELKDNGSPNWQYVEANDHGVLDWYEIPGSPSTQKTKSH